MERRAAEREGLRQAELAAERKRVEEKTRVDVARQESRVKGRCGGWWKFW